MYIQKKLEDLPKEIQNVLYSVDIERLVTQIGQENSLHIDEIGILMDEIRQVFIGATPVAKFRDEIERMLNLEKIAATKIAQDVNTAIFEPLHDELMRVTSQDSEHPADIVNAISNPESIPSPTRTIEVAQAQASPTQAVPISTTTGPIGSTPVAPIIAPAITSATTSTTPATIITPVPPLSPTQTPSLPHEVKLEDTVRIAPSVSDPVTAKMKSLIPPEVKDRINKDPYKETI